MSKEFDLNTAKNLMDDLQKGERFYRAYKDAGAIASTVANLLQAEKDAQDRVSKAKANEAKELELLGKRKAEAESSLDRAFADIQSAVNEASSIRSQAVEDAKRVKAAAEKQVAEYKESCVASLDNLAGQIEQKKNELFEIASAINKASSEHAAINKALENAKSKLRDILG